MKKQLLIIGLAVAVVLCIAAAGCTGTTSEISDKYVGTWEYSYGTPLNMNIQSDGVAYLTKDGGHEAEVFNCFEDGGKLYLVDMGYITYPEGKDYKNYETHYYADEGRFDNFNKESVNGKQYSTAVEIVDGNLQIGNKSYHKHNE